MVGTVGVLGTSDNVPASNATITNPASVAYDRSGNLFIAEGNTGLANGSSNSVYQVRAPPFPACNLNHSPAAAGFPHHTRRC